MTGSGQVPLHLASAPQAGPIGLVVVVALGIAIVFLGRSLMHHLGKVPESFDPPAEAGPGKKDSEAGTESQD